MLGHSKRISLDVATTPARCAERAMEFGQKEITAMSIAMKWYGAVSVGLVLAGGGVAQGVIPYTETFTGNANGWLTGASTALDYVASGGPDGSSYVSYETAVAYPAEPPAFGSPLILLFRGNNAQNA